MHVVGSVVALGDFLASIQEIDRGLGAIDRFGPHDRDDAFEAVHLRAWQRTVIVGEVNRHVQARVDLEVVDSEMAIRGDTATGVTKKVTTSTGLIVLCPQFVKVGDTIRVDTRTGEYVTRV